MYITNICATNSLADKLFYKHGFLLGKYGLSRVNNYQIELILSFFAVHITHGFQRQTVLFSAPERAGLFILMSGATLLASSPAAATIHP
jgi:hypothetical protein